MPPPTAKPPLQYSISKRRRRKPPDLLSALPPDISVQVLEQLHPTDLRRVPQVSPRWASLFSPDSPLESALRALVIQHFGIRQRPSHFLSWGQLYLALRGEACHLCPAKDIAPFVYAGSSCLGLDLDEDQDNQERLALFPVCRPCFGRLLSSPLDSFAPVIEKHAVQDMFSTDTDVDRFEGVGYLYSDIPGFATRTSQRKIHFALAWPLARLFPDHRLFGVRNGNTHHPQI